MLNYFCFVCLISGLFVGLSSCNLIVSLSGKSNKSDNPVKLISFCVGCPFPESEGSAAYGLASKHLVKDYHAIGELIYCVPNYAELPKILNLHNFNNRIVLVDRGVVGIIDKVNRILKSDALGIIIADDGRCNEDFSFCGQRAGSVMEGGFAAYDDNNIWRKVNIPVILVTVKTADKLRSMMHIRKVNIPRLGLHNVTIFDNDDDGEL